MLRKKETKQTKKMIILEVGVDIPVFYEKEKPYRFLIHLD